MVERPPPLVDVAGFGELAADRPVAHALLVQPLDQVDDLGSLLGGAIKGTRGTSTGYRAGDLGGKGIWPVRKA